MAKALQGQIIPLEAISAGLVEAMGERLAPELQLGFSGPRIAMKEAQHHCIEAILDALPEVLGAHHGDCVGADAEFHGLCIERKLPVFIHPPTDESNRSFCQGAEVLPPLGYLARNRSMAESISLLLIAPRDDREVQRSGIWATVRHARKKGKTILIALSDGSLLLEDPLP